MSGPRISEIKQPFANDTVNLALDTIGLKKQALFFVGSKRGAEKCAEDIALKIQHTDATLESIAESIIHAIAKPTRQCERLARCVNKSIAFHHSGLTAGQRDIIEDNFKSGKIKIICCTPTLAAGVDLPAFRAVIRDLKRYSSTGWGGMQYIPVLEYLQMAGRAGRPKFDTVGETICIAATEQEKENIRERYIKGVPEDIYSKLAVEPVLRTYLLSLIATDFVRSRKEIVQFFAKTFWAHQFRDMPKLESIIDKVLDLLERYEFITMKQKSGDFISADELKEEKEHLIRPTMLGRRVAQLYIDPLTAHHLIKRIRRSTERMVSPFGILQMVCNTLEMRPLLRVKTKEFEKFNEQYAKFESDILQKEPSIYEAEYDDFLASVKTAFFMYDWIGEKDEEFLYTEYDIRPGETRVKIDKADWLLYSCEEIAKLMSFHDVLKHISKVRFRLRYGVKEELIPLLKLSGIGRVRARKLHNSGIKDIGSVKRADVTSLAQLVGKATALSIKKQVGEDIEQAVVPDGKRKGQLSLGKYT
ncbi:MAG: helicase-related protein [Candidatus Woesearchaeota archaeon]